MNNVAMMSLKVSSMSEADIITATAGLGQYGAIGVVLLSIGAVVLIMILTLRFLANQSELNRSAIAEQSELNRKSHKENAEIMSSALKEVTQVVSSFAKENKEDHLRMQNTDQLIMRGLAEIKEKLR